MGLHHTILEEMARSAVILRKTIAKHHVAAGTNSPSTTNEKRTTKAQRNLLKRKRSKPEHKAPKRHVEVGANRLHRNKATYIPVSPRQQICPAAADPHRGQERCWRGIGDRNPLSLFNRPREEQIKSTRMTWYSSWEKAKQTIKAKRRFLINTKEYQQTQFDKPTAGYSTHPPTASHSTCPPVRRSRAARYRMPRHPRTCRAPWRDCKSYMQGVGQVPPIPPARHRSRFSSTTSTLIVFVLQLRPTGIPAQITTRSPFSTMESCLAQSTAWRKRASCVSCVRARTG